MKKSIKLLILALVVVLLGVLAFLMLKGDENEVVEEEVDTSFSVRVLPCGLSELKLVNSEGEFNFVKENGLWYSIFSEKTEAYGNTIISLESIIKEPIALDLIEENVASIDKYGLSEPTALATYKLENGEEGYIKLGHAVLGTKYYFTLDDKNVYTMHLNEAGLFMAGMSAFADMSLVNVPIEEISEITLYNHGEIIQLYKKGEDELMKEGADALFTYALKKPVHENASPNDVQNFLTKASNVRAASYDPYANDAECGVNEINKYFTYKTANESGRFTLGHSENGYTYVKKQGVKGVYSVSDDALSFVFTEAFELVDKHIALYYMEEVSKITVSCGDERYELTYGDKFTINGKEIAEETAQDIFKALIGLTYDGNVENKVKVPNSEIRIVFETKNGNDITDYVSYDAMNYGVLRNGAMEFTIQRKYVDKILTLLKEF